MPATSRYDHHRERSTLHSIIGEVVAVVREPADAEERVAGRHGVGAIGDTRHYDVLAVQRTRSNASQQVHDVRFGHPLSRSSSRRFYHCLHCFEPFFAGSAVLVSDLLFAVDGGIL